MTEKSVYFRLGDFATSVNRFLAGRGLTYRHLAQYTNQEHTTVWRLLNGKVTSPSIDLLASLASYCGLNLDHYVATPGEPYCGAKHPAWRLKICGFKAGHTGPHRCHMGFSQHDWWPQTGQEGDTSDPERSQ